MPSRSSSSRASSSTPPEPGADGSGAVVWMALGWALQAATVVVDVAGNVAAAEEDRWWMEADATLAPGVPVPVSA
jgi:hypothetical protein